MLSNYVDNPSTGESKDHDDVEVDETVGGVVLLQANPGRKTALIMNVGSGEMRVTTDGSSPTATHGKLVSSGGALYLESPYCPTDVIKAIRQGSVDTVANASEVS